MLYPGSETVLRNAACVPTRQTPRSLPAAFDIIRNLLSQRVYRTLIGG
jgi:hypothetical protein